MFEGCPGWCPGGVSGGRLVKAKQLKGSGGLMGGKGGVGGMSSVWAKQHLKTQNIKAKVGGIRPP